MKKFAYLVIILSFNVWATPNGDSLLKSFAKEEVAQHNSEDDLWVILEGRVYNLTEFIKQGDHPGGLEPLLAQAGKDATEEFQRVLHSDDAKKQMEEFLIGELKQ